MEYTLTRIDINDIVYAPSRTMLGTVINIKNDSAEVIPLVVVIKRQGRVKGKMLFGTQSCWVPLGELRKSVPPTWRGLAVNVRQSLQATLQILAKL